MRRALVLAIAAGAIAASCTPDPTHDSEVTALGGEAPGVSPGPLHRPGQPCLVCHGGDGPAKQQFAVAGTVYQALGDMTPLQGGVVQVFDVNNVEHHASTNAVGNFYIESSSWPGYPLHGINVSYLDTTADMTATVGRDGSCATCHFEGRGDAGRSATTPGHVYLVDDPSNFPTSNNGGGSP
jgi:hypothetical protein